MQSFLDEQLLWGYTLRAHSRISGTRFILRGEDLSHPHFGKPGKHRGYETKNLWANKNFSWIMFLVEWQVYVRLFFHKMHCGCFIFNHWIFPINDHNMFSAYFSYFPYDTMNYSCPNSLIIKWSHIARSSSKMIERKQTLN